MTNFIELCNKIITLHEQSKKPDKNDGEEGEDWVRPGSDLDPGMDIGGTNFPHGHGYPNYSPKEDDESDFKEIARLDYIVDVPYETVDKDYASAFRALQKLAPAQYPKKKKKYRKTARFIFNQGAESFKQTNFNTRLVYYRENPIGWKIYDEIPVKDVTKEDIETARKIDSMFWDLTKKLPFKNNPEDPKNYPLFVTLYDITRVLGGYEEGGWWTDSYDPIQSIAVKTPDQLLPAAEKLYSMISHADLDGKPVIYVEKKSGSQQGRDIYKWE